MSAEEIIVELINLGFSGADACPDREEDDNEDDVESGDTAAKLVEEILRSTQVTTRSESQLKLRVERLKMYRPPKGRELALRPLALTLRGTSARPSSGTRIWERVRIIEGVAGSLSNDSRMKSVSAASIANATQRATWSR
jgi:hypothetical protein